MNNRLLKEYKINEKINITVYGLFYYKDFMAGEESVKNFYADLKDSKRAFDFCYGSYRIKIEMSDRKIIFSDNSGMMRFYINLNTCEYAVNLKGLTEGRKLRLNYKAIAQMLYFGAIYTEGSIFESVVISDPESYYVIKGNQVIIKSKRLNESYDSSDTMEKVMKRFCHAVGGEIKLGCTLTGGCDSRAVLSHLNYNSIRPKLCIMDFDVPADIEVARKIAETLDLRLKVIPKDLDDAEYLNEAVEATDGSLTAELSLIFLRKIKWMEKEKIDIECGGFAGELYKNSFINQDYPFYHGKPKWDKFYKYKIAAYDFPKIICGKKLRKEIDDMPFMMTKYLKMNYHGKKAKAYLRAGYDILRARYAPLGILESQYYVRYNPLFERCLSMYAYERNPFSLEMQAFQRGEVSRFCPDIMDIPTDRGLTCNDKTKGKEFINSMLYLAPIYLKRKFMINRKLETAEINPQIFTSEIWDESLEKCRKHGILNENSVYIPAQIGYRIMALASQLK